MRVEQYIDERDSRDAVLWDAEADLYHTGGIACKPDTRRAHKPSTFQAEVGESQASLDYTAKTNFKNHWSPVGVGDTQGRKERR